MEHISLTKIVVIFLIGWYFVFISDMVAIKYFHLVSNFKDGWWSVKRLRNPSNNHDVGCNKQRESRKGHGN